MIFRLEECIFNLIIENYSLFIIRTLLNILNYKVIIILLSNTKIKLFIEKDFFKSYLYLKWKYKNKTKAVEIQLYYELNILMKKKYTLKKMVKS